MDSRLNKLALVSETTVADLSAVAATPLYTVPVGRVLYPHSASLECDGDVGAALECSIGQNGAVTDFVDTTNGDNLDADNDFILMAPVPSATPATLKKYAAGTVIEFDVAVGGNAVGAKVLLYGIERIA
jgi:hypothetical protein